MNLSLNQEPQNVLQDAIAKPEIDLLICCSRTRLNDAIKKQICLLVQQDIDWEYLISLASKHGVLPLLFNSLNNTCPEAIPKKTLSKLRSFFQQNIQRNLLLTSQLLKILEIFQANGVNAVPFKGPMLAVSVYGNPAYRQFCDLDIFVKKKDFSKAKKLLLCNQYQLHLTRIEEIFLSNHAFQTSFQHSNCMSNIDLHWGIAPRKPRLNSRFDCLWNNLESISIGGKSVSSFSPESTLVIQGINATKEPEQQSLKKICDLNEIIQKYPDLSWEKVLYQARKLGCKRLLLVGLCLTQKFYGSTLPNEIVQNISSAPIVQELAEELRQRFFLNTSQLENNFAKSYFVNRYNWQSMDIRDRIPYVFDKIVTPHSEDRQFVSLPPSLYYLYYLIRPIRLIGQSKVLFEQKSPLDR